MADWKGQLAGFFEESKKSRVEAEQSEMAGFLSRVVIPALNDLRAELMKHGRSVVVRESRNSAVIVVSHNGEEEISYRIQSRTFPNTVLPFAEIRFRERRGRRLISVESMFRSGSHDYSLNDVTKGEIIENFLENYTTRVRPEV